MRKSELQLRSRPGVARRAVAHGGVCWWVAAVLAAGLPGAALQAQATAPAAGNATIPGDGPQARSVGLPPLLRPFLGPYLGLGGPAAGGGLLGGGVYHGLLNPAIGVLGIQGEGYVGRSAHGGVDGRMLLGLRSPALSLGTGLEIDLPHGEASPFLSFMHPIGRGGLLVPGSLLHATWSFGGADRFRLGLAIPIGQPLVGEDRPRHDRVQVPAPAGSAAISPVAPAATDPLARAAASLVESIRRVSAVIVPYAGQSQRRVAGEADVVDSLRTLQATLTAAGPRPVPAVVAGYHAALDLACSVALDPQASAITPQGRALAESMRGVLLGSVLLPYDRVLGQKRADDTFARLAAGAQDAFAGRSGGIAAADARGAAGGRVAWVLAQVLGAMDEIVRGQTRRWGDARLVWLPLQLALRDEQHQTQAQIDSLLARGTGGEFSDSNQVAYVRNEQFQWQLYRSIQDARSYHVLWVHDFRGLNEAGRPDGIAYRQVAFGYLDALIKRVRDYDRTGVLPEYHIINDQFYFEGDHSRFWMELLSDPLDRRVRLRGAPAAWQKTLDSLQAVLRSSVAASRRLQAEAREHGQAWLKDRVSVRVHITQQADPSFFSPDIFPLIGLTDNVLRDHRKLAFYDLTEGDPYRGLLIVTGMGVGENFASPEWEDRAVLLRGPAALQVKREAAALLLGQGLKPNQLPEIFRPSSEPVAAAGRAPVPSFGLVPARVMQIHNEVGYGDKRITVAKAMLYSLMPSGTVAKIPDSLWNNPLWASLLLGQALRGGSVVIMAPSVKNAPAPGAPEMSLAETVLSRLLVASHELAPTLARAGGMLHVGIYDVGIPVDDLQSRIDTALATRAKTPWLRQLDPFAPEVVDSLRAVAAQLRAAGFRSTAATTPLRAPGGSGGGIVGSNAAEAGGHPKLHLKEQFFASGEGWQDLFLEPGWGHILAEYFRERARLIHSRANYAEFYRIKPAPGDGGAPGAATTGLTFKDQVQADKPNQVVYYLLLGSHNEDYRSALLDGESMLVLSHFGAVVGIDDFVLLPGLCQWVDTPEQLHKYLPLQSARTQRLARWTRIMY